jgi:hypothetical protein
MSVGHYESYQRSDFRLSLSTIVFKVSSMYHKSDQCTGTDGILKTDLLTGEVLLMVMAYLAIV